MPEGQSFPERLRALRQRGKEALAPLWIEQLSPEEALAELKARPGAIFRLLEAKSLQELGHLEESEEVLRQLGDLPPGLHLLFDELWDNLRAWNGPKAEDQDGPPPERRPTSAVDVRNPGQPLEAALSAWLEAVQRWRRVLSV